MSCCKDEELQQRQEVMSGAFRYGISAMETSVYLYREVWAVAESRVGLPARQSSPVCAIGPFAIVIQPNLLQLVEAAVDLIERQARKQG